MGALWVCGVHVWASAIAIGLRVSLLGRDSVSVPPSRKRFRLSTENLDPSHTRVGAAPPSPPACQHSRQGFTDGDIMLRSHPSRAGRFGALASGSRGALGTTTRRAYEDQLKKEMPPFCSCSCGVRR